MPSPVDGTINRGTEQKMKQTLAIAVIVIGLIVPCIAASGNSNPCVPGSYQLVESRGGVRVIVVRPSCKNLKAMKALGEKLRSDFAGKSFISVQIFDNMRAVKMFDQTLNAAGDRGTEPSRFYDTHNIGSYVKNANTGMNQYLIWLQGYNDNGPEVEIHC
jgi:hypothetical protein